MPSPMLPQSGDKLSAGWLRDFVDWIEREIKPVGDGRSAIVNGNVISLLSRDDAAPGSDSNSILIKNIHPDVPVVYRFAVMQLTGIVFYEDGYTQPDYIGRGKYSFGAFKVTEQNLKAGLPIVVLQDDIPYGKTGRALAAGVTPIFLADPNAGKYAAADPDNPGWMTAGSEGHEILWKAAAGSAVSPNAIVQLGKMNAPEVKAGYDGQFSVSRQGDSVLLVKGGTVYVGHAEFALHDQSISYAANTVIYVGFAAEGADAPTVLTEKPADLPMFQIAHIDGNGNIVQDWQGGPVSIWGWFL